ncbi:MAG: hypothetical protein QHH13_13170 [Melioribacter sp.]|uniref:hypothetical protein n=1 Tax=Rosettibacter primus TaxID=3111523 RepID=UPI00247E47DD|nr:hypothetical protein [Melioribacter sp.]
MLKDERISRLWVSINDDAALYKYSIAYLFHEDESNKVLLETYPIDLLINFDDDPEIVKMKIYNYCRTKYVGCDDIYDLFSMLAGPDIDMSKFIFYYFETNIEEIAEIDDPYSLL